MTESFSPLRRPDWQRDGMRHIWMPYCQMHTAPTPVPVAETEGVFLILEDGRRLIDGLASWWTACHGYNHPHIVAAVEDQLRRMPHVMFGGIHHEPALRLAARLSRLLPGNLNRVFFCDSGSVAVEVALKMAVQYWLNRGVTGRNRFVAFRDAYHGDTTGAMSLCDPVNSMHSRFAGLLLEQHSLEIPHTKLQASQFDNFVREHCDRLAGVFVEPLIQAAGGMKFHPPEAVAMIRETCDRYGMLLIADELATGFGRTGSMFAVEQSDVVPDIICLGKALTGGTMGLAATVARDSVFDAFLSDDPAHALMHGPTFMANPLACAAANASLDLFETEPRPAQVKEIERQLTEALQSCSDRPGVVDVRCRGAVGVIQVERLHHLDRLRHRFVEDGVWLRPFGDVIYVTPPLCITPTELTTLLESLVRVVDEWSTWTT